MSEGNAVVTATTTDHKGRTVTDSCEVKVEDAEYLVTFIGWNNEVIKTETVKCLIRNEIFPVRAFRFQPQPSFVLPARVQYEIPFAAFFNGSVNGAGLKGEEVQADDLAAAYQNGRAVKPVPVLIWNGKKLSNKNDLKVYPAYSFIFAQSVNNQYMAACRNAVVARSKGQIVIHIRFRLYIKFQ